MKIVLPELGEGIESAKVIQLLVSEGDTVKADDEVVEVETDKAVAGVPAESAGKVSKILVGEGDEVSVGDPLVELEESSGEDGDEAAESAEGDSESASKEDKSGSREEEKQPEQEAAETGPEKEDSGREEPAEKGRSGEEPGKDRSRGPRDRLGPPAGPELRELARELGIDLQRVRGSARGGRITMADLRGYIEKIQREAFADHLPGPEFEDLSSYGSIHSEDLPSIRKSISRRLLHRWQTTPLVTQFGEARLDRILELKERCQPQAGEREVNLTLSAFFLMVLARILKKYPKFNAALDLEAGKIIYREYLHMGVAVATDKGLLVPVVRNVDKMDLLELAEALELVSGKARSGKLSSGDSAGASFYFSNQGAIGG